MHSSRQVQLEQLQAERNALLRYALQHPPKNVEVVLPPCARSIDDIDLTLCPSPLTTYAEADAAVQVASSKSKRSIFAKKPTMFVLDLSKLVTCTARDGNNNNNSNSAGGDVVVPTSQSRRTTAVASTTASSATPQPRQQQQEQLLSSSPPTSTVARHHKSSSVAASYHADAMAHSAPGEQQQQQQQLLSTSEAMTPTAAAAVAAGVAQSASRRLASAPAVVREDASSPPRPTGGSSNSTSNNNNNYASSNSLGSSAVTPTQQQQQQQPLLVSASSSRTSRHHDASAMTSARMPTVVRVPPTNVQSARQSSAQSSLLPSSSSVPSASAATAPGSSHNNAVALYTTSVPDNHALVTQASSNNHVDNSAAADATGSSTAGGNGGLALMLSHLFERAHTRTLSSMFGPPKTSSATAATTQRHGSGNDNNGGGGVASSPPPSVTSRAVTAASCVRGASAAAAAVQQSSSPTTPAAAVREAVTRDGRIPLHGALPCTINECIAVPAHASAWPSSVCGSVPSPPTFALQPLFDTAVLQVLGDEFTVMVYEHVLMATQLLLGEDRALYEDEVYGVYGKVFALPPAEHLHLVSNLMRPSLRSTVTSGGAPTAAQRRSVHTMHFDDVTLRRLRRCSRDEAFVARVTRLLHAIDAYSDDTDDVDDGGNDGGRRGSEAGDNKRDEDDDDECDEYDDDDDEYDDDDDNDETQSCTTAADSCSDVVVDGAHAATTVVQAHRRRSNAYATAHTQPSSQAPRRASLRSGNGAMAAATATARAQAPRAQQQQPRRRRQRRRPYPLALRATLLAGALWPMYVCDAAGRHVYTENHIHHSVTALLRELALPESVIGYCHLHARLLANDRAEQQSLYRFLRDAAVAVNELSEQRGLLLRQPLTPAVKYAYYVLQEVCGVAVAPMAWLSSFFGKPELSCLSAFFLEACLILPPRLLSGYVCVNGRPLAPLLTAASATTTASSTSSASSGMQVLALLSLLLTSSTLASFVDCLPALRALHKQYEQQQQQQQQQYTLHASSPTRPTSYAGITTATTTATTTAAAAAATVTAVRQLFDVCSRVDARQRQYCALLTRSIRCAAELTLPARMQMGMYVLLLHWNMTTDEQNDSGSDVAGGRDRGSNDSNYGDSNTSSRRRGGGTSSASSTSTTTTRRAAAAAGSAVSEDGANNKDSHKSATTASLSAALLHKLRNKPLASHDHAVGVHALLDYLRDAATATEDSDAGGSGGWNCSGNERTCCTLSTNTTRAHYCEGTAGAGMTTVLTLAAREYLAPLDVLAERHYAAVLRSAEESVRRTWTWSLTPSQCVEPLAPLMALLRPFASTAQPPLLLPPLAAAPAAVQQLAVRTFVRVAGLVIDCIHVSLPRGEGGASTTTTTASSTAAAGGAVAGGSSGSTTGSSSSSNSSSNNGNLSQLCVQHRRVQTLQRFLSSAPVTRADVLGLVHRLNTLSAVQDECEGFFTASVARYAQVRRVTGAPEVRVDEAWQTVSQRLLRTRGELCELLAATLMLYVPVYTMLTEQFLRTTSDSGGGSAAATAAASSGGGSVSRTSGDGGAHAHAVRLLYPAVTMDAVLIELRHALAEVALLVRSACRDEVCSRLGVLLVALLYGVYVEGRDVVLRPSDADGLLNDLGDVAMFLADALASVATTVNNNNNSNSSNSSSSNHAAATTVLSPSTAAAVAALRTVFQRNGVVGVGGGGHGSSMSVSMATTANNSLTAMPDAEVLMAQPHHAHPLALQHTGYSSTNRNNNSSSSGNNSNSSSQHYRVQSAGASLTWSTSTSAAQQQQQQLLLTPTVLLLCHLLRELRNIVRYVMTQESSVLVSGGVGVPPLHSLPEMASSSPWCRHIVRKVLEHRRDKAARQATS